MCVCLFVCIYMYIGEKKFYGIFLAQNYICNIFIKNDQNLNKKKKSFKAWNLYFRMVTIFFNLCEFYNFYM